MQKRIVLKSRNPDTCVGVVKLTPSAERVVRHIRDKTGLSIRQIVSEIILQAEELITFDTSEDEE